MAGRRNAMAERIKPVRQDAPRPGYREMGQAMAARPGVKPRFRRMGAADIAKARNRGNDGQKECCTNPSPPNEALFVPSRGTQGFRPPP
jgi:hypothetical protein